MNKVLSTSQASASLFLFGKIIDFPGLQLILEAERQRKYAEDIDAAKIMLNHAQLMCSMSFPYYRLSNTYNEQTGASPIIVPLFRLHCISVYSRTTGEHYSYMHVPSLRSTF